MSSTQVPFPNLHPSVTLVSKSLYDSGHYTDALRKASIKLEEECKSILKEKTGDEDTGAVLMSKLFCADKNTKVVLFPFVNLDLKDSSDKQKSFYFLFSGFTGAIRNTLAHDSSDLEDIEALYGLNIVSYLFHKIDRAKEMNNVEKVIKTEIVDNTEMNDFLVETLLLNKSIKDTPKHNNDPTTAKLDIEKNATEILVSLIDEISVERFNYFTTNKDKIILMVLKKLYDE